MDINKDTVLRVIEMIKADQSVHNSTRVTLNALLSKDPVDALHETELLYRVMKAYNERLFDGMR